MMDLALAHAPPPSGDPAIAAALHARAREIELPALLDLLHDCYPDHTVRFCSRRSTHAAANAVHRVDVVGGTVLVTLNLGFFSASSPLPSYFHRLLDDPFVHPGLEILLRVVDDALLRAELHAFLPEAAWRSLDERMQLRRNLLRSAQVASPSTVAWILEAAFPELTVSVERVQLPAEVRTHPARTGYAVLGHDALGARGRGKTPGLRARLHGAKTSWARPDWALEAPRRTRELVLPSLAGTRLRLHLVMDLRGLAHPLELEGNTVLGIGTLGIDSSAPLVLFDDVVA